MAPLNEKPRRPIGNRVLVSAMVSAMVSALVVLGGAETAERAWAEPLVVPGADQTAGPARRTGVGFEFRRRLSTVDNPYCDIAPTSCRTFRSRRLRPPRMIAR
jgi:hypothetical protein